MLLKLLLLTTSVFAYAAICKQIPHDVVKIWNNLIKTYHNHCLLEANLNSSQIAQMIKDAHVPDEIAFGCYFKCIYLKLEFLNADGEFNNGLIVSKASYMSEKLVEECVNEAINKTELCQKSLIAATCTVDNISV